MKEDIILIVDLRLFPKIIIHTPIMMSLLCENLLPVGIDYEVSYLSLTRNGT